MADLGDEQFNLSKLLTGAFQANPAWKDLADATTEVLTKNVESHRRKLARIRDTVQNRQGDIVNDVYYTGGRVEDTAGDPIPLATGTRIPSAKILRIEQNNSARLELGIDYALIEFTLANGQPAYWRMPMNAPQERSILIDNAKMLGFDFFNTALSDEDYQRLNEYVSLYWPEGGTENFIRFISFLKNISLEMAPLWSKDDGLDEFPILDARDPNDNERVPAYLGGEWYQTSHVELRYDPIRDVDPTETFEIQMAFYREIENLFYLFAPIILVLERIVATITLYWFVYVGTSAHETEIWQEKLVIDPLPTIACDVYINSYEPINSDCLINLDDSCSIYVNTQFELINSDCYVNLGDNIVECPEFANSELLANTDCPSNPGEEIPVGCTPIITPRFDPASFIISTNTYDNMGAVHLTSDTNPYAPGITTSWVGLKLYNEVSEEIDTYVFLNGADVDGDYAFLVNPDNVAGTPSFAGYFGYHMSDLAGAPDGSFDAPLYGIITHSLADFSGFTWGGDDFVENFENAGYAAGREVVKVLVSGTARHVISVLEGTDIQIHTMPKLQNSIVSTVTIHSGNVFQVAAEWHTIGDSVKIVYLDGNGQLLMTGLYHLTDETFHNHVRVDDTALAVQTYLNMSAWDGTTDTMMRGRYGAVYLGVENDGSGALFYHELQPGYYPSWDSVATTPEIVFSFAAMTETGYETESAEIPIAAAIILGPQSDTRMVLVVVRRWEYNAPDWEPLLYVCAYERADGAWVKSADDYQLTFAGDSNVKNLDAIGDYLEARIVVDKSSLTSFSNFLFTVVHERAMGSTRDFVGVPLNVDGCNNYLVVE